MATGSNAVATGENLTREQFNERREIVAEIERQIGEKRTEMSQIDAEIANINLLISNVNTRITTIEQRQVVVANLLKRKEQLENQRNSVQQTLVQQQSALTEANAAYNKLTKDSQGNSIYNNYDNVFKKLDWSKLSDTSGSGREQLAADIKNIVRNDFTELADTFTDEQYKELVDGYLARNLSGKKTAEYLEKYMLQESNGYFKETYYNYFSKGSIYTTLFEGMDHIDIPDYFNVVDLGHINYISNQVANRYNNFGRDLEKNKKTLISTMLFLFSSKNSDSNSNHILNNYNHSVLHSSFLSSLPPIIEKIKQNDFSLPTRDSSSIYYVLDGSTSKSQLVKERDNINYLLSIIDDSKKDSWWFDLDDYKKQVGKVVEFYDYLIDYSSLQEQLKNELSKPIAQQNKAEIDRINAEILQKKEFINAEKDNKERYLVNLNYNYKTDILESEFANAKLVLEEIRAQTKDYIQTYDDNHAIVKATKEKSSELQQAVKNAENNVKNTQSQIDSLIRQISNLGLTDDDNLLADKKRELEEQLRQREQEKLAQQQELASKQAALDKLNDDLANSPLKNLGENTMAEGNNAFASGKNAIAYGANSLAIAENAVAFGSNAQATAKNSTALGSNAVATGVNSVAVGQGSKATAENEFSVGNKDENLTRKITNVSKGEADTDAVNVSQLKGEITTVNNTINQKFETVNNKVDAVDGKVQTLETKVDREVTAVNNKIETEVNKVNQRVDGVETKVETLNTKVDTQFEKVNTRVDGVDNKVNQLNSKIESEIDKVIIKVDGVDHKIDTEIGKVNTRIDAVDVEIGKVNNRIDTVDAKVDKEIVKVSEKITQEVGKVDTKANSIAKLLGATVTQNGLVEAEYHYYVNGEKQTTDNVKTAIEAISQENKHFKAKSDGNAATASGEESVAMGGNSVAAGKNSVAIGSNSMAANDNEVSMGNAALALARRVTNVADGLDNNDVVNVKQLNKVDAKANSIAQVLGGTVTSNGLVEAEYEYYQQGETKKVNNVKTAINAISQNTKYHSANSTGNAAAAKGAESVAIGGNSVATGANSVAIGSGSAATAANEFSVGNAVTGLTRRVTNVADGVASSDAVNVGQLNRGLNSLENKIVNVDSRVNQLDSKINRTEKRLSGGIAGAYAASALVTAPAAGESMLSVGTGAFNGASAVAVGYSKVSDSGKVSFKLHGSASNRGDVGGGAAIGFKF